MASKLKLNYILGQHENNTRNAFPQKICCKAVSIRWATIIIIAVTIFVHICILILPIGKLVPSDPTLKFIKQPTPIMEYLNKGMSVLVIVANVVFIFGMVKTQELLLVPGILSIWFSQAWNVYFCITVLPIWVTALISISSIVLEVYCSLVLICYFVERRKKRLEALPNQIPSAPAEIILDQAQQPPKLYPGQQYPGQPYQRPLLPPYPPVGSPYPAQPYSGQPAYSPVSGSPYPGQPYPGQPYPAQPYPGQPYQEYPPYPR